MAVDDEVFYNILGEEVSRSNLVQEMIDYYSLKLSVGDTRVTDFNEGSEIRNLLEAFAVDVYVLMELCNEAGRIAFIDTSYGEWLDRIGANPFVQLSRNTGDYSTGFVSFSIPAVSSNAVTIPEGTVVLSTDNGLEYGTNREAVIAVGETSVTVAVTCLTVGADGDCPADTVTVIDNDYVDVVGLSVTNSDNITGGVDYEDDDAYRERLLAFVRKDDFGSMGYYIDLCEAVEGVHDVLLVNDASYTKKILVNGDVKPTPDTVLVDVLSAVSDTENLVIGHSFTVDKPSYTTVALTVNLTVEDSDDLTSADVTTLLEDFFNGGERIVGLEFDGLNIGEAVSKNALYGALELFDTVVSVEALYNSSEVTTISVDADKVLKLGTLTINITEAS